MTVEELFALYNEWRVKTWNYEKQKVEHPMRMLKSTPERLAQLQSMSNWCVDKGLDPGKWLYSLFAARKWMFTPPLTQLIPKNLKTSKAWKTYHSDRDTPAWAAYQSRQIEKQQIEQAKVYDPNRDIDTSVEALKARYLAESGPQRCLDEMTTTTLGYHPLSRVCQGCQAAQSCESLIRKLMPFDIIALRKGEITAEQAQLAAGMVRR